MRPRTSTFLIALLTVGGLAGCSHNTKGDDSSSAGDTGHNGGGDDTSVDSDAPVIQSADAWCYSASTGEVTETYVAKAIVTDPQGTDTLQSFYQGLTVLQGGMTLADEYLSCLSDGTCTGGFQASSYGMTCASATQYTFRFVVADEDGNTSEPVEVTAREGTDATGR